MAALYQLRRTVTAAPPLRGHPVATGDQDVIWYVSNNRDEEAFAKPYRFNIRHRRNNHCTFGDGGPYFCLGAHLEHWEIAIFLEELWPRVAAIDLVQPAQRVRSNFVRGAKTLPAHVRT